MEASPDAGMLSWRKMAATRSSLTGQTRTVTSTRNSGCRWAWSARRPEAAPTTESQSSEVALLLALFCFRKLHKTQIFSLAKTFNLRLIYDRFVAIKIFHNFSSIFSFTQGHECKVSTNACDSRRQQPITPIVEWKLIAEWITSRRAHMMFTSFYLFNCMQKHGGKQFSRAHTRDVVFDSLTIPLSPKDTHEDIKLIAPEHLRGEEKNTNKRWWNGNCYESRKPGLAKGKYQRKSKISCL